MEHVASRQKLIIFEGIASSGKTTLIKEMKNKLDENFSVEVVGEDETLMPFIDNKSKEVALEFIKKFLDSRIKNLKASVIIIDRLHLTHAFRTKSSITYFRNVEDYLLKHYQTYVILLKIAENKIQSRIEHANFIRGERWEKGKAGTMEEKIDYYKTQQGYLLEISKESQLKLMQIDTTSMNWVEIADSIINDAVLVR